MTKKQRPLGEQWILRRVEPGKPYDNIDIEGYGVRACKMSISLGTHVFTTAGADAEPEEEGELQ
jgi:hypothetical protein